MININYGHNKELMDRCRKLKEYALFIDTIRCYLNQNKHWTREQAIVKAVDKCIEQDILREILQKERLRVMASILAEFDEIGYREMIHEEAYEEGLEKGKKDGIRQGIEEGRKKGIKEGIKEGRKEGIEEGIRTLIEFAQDCGYGPDVIMQQLAQRFQLSEEEASGYMEKYLKRK